MFTGIIEAIGQVEEILMAGANKTFRISSVLSGAFKPDQSVAHNGVCLTVEEIKGTRHQVTAIAETLQKSNLDSLKTGDLINLERCLPLNGRLDGHLVQGHVDTVATCTGITDRNGSHEFRFRFPADYAPLIIEKGSVSLNGISLTAFNVTKDGFSVAVIPYTLEHTNIRNCQPGTTVNIEFDMIGKYVQRLVALKS